VAKRYLQRRRLILNSPVLHRIRRERLEIGQEEKTRRKKLTGPAEHNFIESADYRNPRGRARKKRSTRYRQSNCRNYLLDAQLEAEAQAWFRPFRKPRHDRIVGSSSASAASESPAHSARFVVHSLIGTTNSHQPSSGKPSCSVYPVHNPNHLEPHPCGPFWKNNKGIPQIQYRKFLPNVLDRIACASFPQKRIALPFRHRITEAECGAEGRHWISTC